VTRQVGWRARRHAGVIDIDARGAYDPLDFWDPVYARKQNGIVLESRRVLHPGVARSGFDSAGFRGGDDAVQSTRR